MMLGTSLCRGARGLGFVIVTTFALAAPAAATNIERVVSPGGIEAWLVREPAVPVVALDFAFTGGANEDPADEPGLAHMVASLIDEGSGDMDSETFHRTMEDNAIELSFSAGRDGFRGSLRTLTANRDLGFDLLRLSLTAPRFDEEPVERIRSELLADLRRASTSPSDIANENWWATAYAGHPYAAPVHGTIDAVTNIAIPDLKTYTQRVFARSRLKIAIVGDIDTAAAGQAIDKIFGALPQSPTLAPVAPATMHGLGGRKVIPLDVPQAVIAFGGEGIARGDPDFFPAYLVNHILGGGSMSSRIYREVRENRGLAYGIWTGLVYLQHAALFTGQTATRADRAGETLEIIEREVQNMADNGPTEAELAKTKSYLKGAYALSFDTSTKIAAQLVQIQIDDLGIDYINRRNAMIDAVTLDDAKRVAKRLFGGKMLFTIVGRPQGVTSNTPAGSGG